MTTSTPDPAEYWETRYREKGGWWSGNANAALEREIGGAAPGTALDLGSGEGGDALWLARNGWSVTAVDISPTALGIGAAAQRDGDDITWIAADLSDWQPPRSYDLVSACFLHSEVQLPREAILRRAAMLRGTPTTPEELRTGWQTEELWAFAALEAAAIALATAVINVGEMLHPDTALIGGGFAVAHEGFVPRIAEQVKRLTRTGQTEITVRPAALGALSSLRGAVELARSMPA